MLIHYCHLFQIIVCTITLWQWEPPLRTAPPLTNITACVASPCTEAAALHRRGATLYWDTHPRRTIIGSVQPKKGRYLVKWLGLDSFYTTTSVKTICSFYWTKLFLNIFSAAAPLCCCVTSNWFDGCDSNFVDAENIKTYSLQSKFVLTFLGDTNFKTSFGDGKGESLFSWTDLLPLYMDTLVETSG